jgi:hypothetical protein
VLREPFTTVRAAYFLDGGSVGIEIVDRDGKRELFALPGGLEERRRYSRLFVGAVHDRREGALEIDAPEHTKLMLIDILATYPRLSPEHDLCLASLSRRPVDFVRYLVRRQLARGQDGGTQLP